LRITSKQFRKIIAEEIQFVLELPAQYDDEAIEACPEPASVVDAWYPSDVMPEEDAWAGGDNLESSVDWAHTSTGESNAGPHMPIERSAVVDDDPLAQRTLEDLIAAILGDSIHEALLEQSDAEDSQDDDDGEEEKEDGDDASSVGGGDTESQPDLGEQLTLPVRNKGSWQQWSGGKDTKSAHGIYESLRQLIRHEIITEQNIECGIARFLPDDVFVPTSKGFIHGGHVDKGTHTVIGYIVNRDKGILLHNATSDVRAGLVGNVCGTIYFQTLSNAEDVPPIELWKSYESAQLGHLGWGTSHTAEPEPVYASTEPPASLEP